RGSPRAYFEMGYAQRREFLARHPPLPPIPTVALASATARAGLFLEKTRRYIAETYGAANDGFVPLQDAHIPGARLVRLEGIDHASIALRWLRPRAPFEPGRVAQALVALAVE
ncbi:MAG TPA: lipase, partial [Myxococcales bacterium]|nr:lipase [Myxococcales bacterium]